MPPLLSISAFRRTDANGGSRGEAMPERENAKIVNAGQKVARKFGHSKDLITLSLSQVLTYSSSHIIKIRGHPRVNIRLFLQRGKGGRSSFLSPATKISTSIFHSIINNIKQRTVYEEKAV